MLMEVSWVLKERCLLLKLCISLSRLIKCCHPLVTVAPWQGALLVPCHIPISHTWVWWETGLTCSLLRSCRLLPHHGFPPLLPWHCSISVISIMQRGCLNLSIPFIPHHALERMPELRQEGACIHTKTRTSAGRGGGEPVEIMVENLRVESVLFPSHRLKGWSPFFFQFFFSKLIFNYILLLHVKQRNFGIGSSKTYNKKLEKCTILEKLDFPCPLVWLQGKSVMSVTLAVESVLRQHTELVPATTRACP